MKFRRLTTALVTGFVLFLTVLSHPVTTHAAPKMIQITARRFAFEPAEITVVQGEPVVLLLKSADVSHGLRIRELSLDVKVGKGATIQVPFTPEKAGDFVGHCSVFCGEGHGKMTLTIHVVKQS